MAGQWVLLPLKVGYLTNTTYGYIKWSKYIKAQPEVVEEKTFF
jgi:nicotinamide mononucleotide transporter